MPPRPTRGFTDHLADETVAFLVRCLPRPPASVLEVGCGRGEVAHRLGRLGYAVDAIDTDPNAVAAARRRGVPARRADFWTVRGGPYDACIFVFALHHLAPLPAAVERVRWLLRAGGRLLVDDYAWEAADAPTVAWFYDLLRVLESTGVTTESRRLPGPWESPLAFWRDRHRRPEREQTGRAIVRAVRSRLVGTRVERGPYLYRNLGRYVRGAGQTEATRCLYEIERRRVEDGSLRALGLRLTARRPAERGARRARPAHPRSAV